MGKEEIWKATTTLMSAVTDALTQVMTWAGSAEKNIVLTFTAAE